VPVLEFEARGEARSAVVEKTSSGTVDCGGWDEGVDGRGEIDEARCAFYRIPSFSVFLSDNC